MWPISGYISWFDCQNSTNFWEDLSITLDLLPGLVRRKWVEKKRRQGQKRDTKSQVACSNVWWYLLKSILLMVQKSGDHQLRLVVYPKIYRGCTHPNGGFLARFLNSLQTSCRMQRVADQNFAGMDLFPEVDQCEFCEISVFGKNWHVEKRS